MLGRMQTVRDSAVRCHTRLALEDTESHALPQRLAQVSEQLNSAIEENRTISSELHGALDQAAAAKAAADLHESVVEDLRAQLAEARRHGEELIECSDRLREELWEARSSLEERDCELLEARVLADDTSRLHQETVRALEAELSVTDGCGHRAGEDGGATHGRERALADGQAAARAVRC